MVYKTHFNALTNSLGDLRDNSLVWLGKKNRERRAGLNLTLKASKGVDLLQIKPRSRKNLYEP
jgi:hypothetical protein